MIKLIAAAVAALTLTGCATPVITEGSPVTEGSSATEKVGRVPELGKPAEATVGSTVYSQFRYWSKTGYRLENPTAIRVVVSTVNLPAGEFVLPATIGQDSGYCTERAAYIDPIAGPRSTVCFVGPSGSSTFTNAKVMPGMVWLNYPLPEPVRVSKSELIVPRTDALKTELLYQGYSNKTVKLSYREYVNDFARPAFFQDVSYDVASFPTTITFRSVKLNLLGADNNGLRYEVLSGF